MSNSKVLLFCAIPLLLSASASADIHVSFTTNTGVRDSYTHGIVWQFTSDQYLTSFAFLDVNGVPVSAGALNVVASSNPLTIRDQVEATRWGGFTTAGTTVTNATPVDGVWIFGTPMQLTAGVFYIFADNYTSPDVAVYSGPVTTTATDGRVAELQWANRRASWTTSGNTPNYTLTTVSSVPEPSTYGAAGLVLLGPAFLRHRSRKR